MVKPTTDEGRFTEVGNGPKHPYKRSCTDVLCCLLFIINVAVLIGFAMYGYTNGDANNVYRGVDQKSNICGGKNSSASAYPYVYFYNPISNGLSDRTCVKACPGLTGNTVSAIDCYSAGNNQNSCAYTVTINSSGNVNSISVSTSIIGYDTYSVIGRICIPSATVFNNAFINYTSTFSDALRQAGIANFIIDVETVSILLFRTGIGCSWLWCSPL